MATLGSCKSSNSLVGGGVLGKKESGVSLLSSANVVNSKAVNSHKGAAKNSKKHGHAKGGTGSVNSSAAAADEVKGRSRQQKNRNRIMIKSTSSVSIADTHTDAVKSSGKP